MQAEIVTPQWATHIISDHTDMDRSPHPVDAEKVSSFRLTLPDDVYFEYAFMDGDGRTRADPGNPVRGDNPWFPEVSALLGPAYRASRYADLPDSLANGRLDRHRLESEPLGGMRRVSVYTPGGHEDETLPLVLVHDGTAFLRVAGLPKVLEALLAEGRIRPARLAFVEPVDRTSEYGFSAPYREFTLDELIPFIEGNYAGSSERVVMGVSLGGLVSAVLALLHPEEFDTVVTFSGAFKGGPENRDFYRGDGSWVVDRLREGSSSPPRWYADVGTIEWLTDVNREVGRALESRGSEHRYAERNAGHNWVNWRNGLAAALEFALQP
ncbi:MAG: alpha/beta hydrolase-fold protein [Trueperaceae bacterium]